MKKTNKTIIEHIPNFLEYIDIEKNMATKSQETYTRLLEKFSNWLTQTKLNNLKPHELTSDHIWQYRVFLANSINPNTGEPIKKSTQNHYLIALRKLLNFFTSRDILSLPAEKIELAKNIDEKKVKFLDLEQIQKLLLAPNAQTKEGLRDRAILETLFSTAMRVAELASLNREQIKIKPNIQDLEITIIGKGNRVRPVYFSNRCIKWLRKYLEARKDNEKALFIRYKGPKNNSRRLTTRSIENIVKKHKIMAGVPLFTVPHTLRHSMATDLVSKGVDIRIIQEMLGHKDIGSTQIYASVTSKKLREVHRKFHGKSSSKP